MKYRIYLLSLLSFLLVINAYGQEISKNINYQAVARDSAGVVLANKPLNLKLEITDSSGIGIFYAENHQIMTNQFGLFNIQIGGGTRISGNYLTIPWGSGKKYIRTSIDLTGGTNYQLLGSNELLSVPYALYALNAVSNTSSNIKFIKDSTSKIEYGLGIGYKALDKLDTTTINPANIAIGSFAGSNLTKSPNVYINNENVFLGLQSGAGVGSQKAGQASNNVMVGNYAGQNINPDAWGNTLMGWGSGRSAFGTYNGKSSFSGNVALGFRTLENVQDASFNVVIGHDNLLTSKSSNYNVSIGAMSSEAFIGDQNVLIGAQTTSDSKSAGNQNVIIGSASAQKLLGDRNVILGAESLSSGVTNSEVIAIGYQSMKNNQGRFNTAIGTQSLSVNTTGSENVALGYRAMASMPKGISNIAIGYLAMSNSTELDNSILIGSYAGRNMGASYNVGIGHYTLYHTSTGNFNTAVGNASLEDNTTGSRNTALGHSVLQRSTSAENNTGTGYAVLPLNTTGINNSAYGTYSMDANTTGNNNSAYGKHSLQDNVSGNNNTSIGAESMYLNVLGSSNTAVGFQSLSNNSNGQNNVAVGGGSLSLNIGGSGLTAIGNGSNVATPTLNNASAIGYNAQVSSSNAMSFGNNSVTKWAFGLPTTAYALQVGSNTTNGNGAYLTTGGTWTNASSIKFKENFSYISNEEILDKINTLEIPRWNYIGTTETHIGPLAEQFKEVFGLGVADDNEHISTIDVSGVAIRAVQALIDRNRIYEEKLLQQERRFLELEKRIQKLEKMIEDKK